MRYKNGFLCFGVVLLTPIIANAQTTLSGDHIITGNLDVGTSGNNGSLHVVGETGNTAAPSISVTGDGGVIFQGTYGTGEIPSIGTGSRFSWYPKKAAIRAGYFSPESESDVGEYSVALGRSYADGSHAVALGGGYSTGEGSFSAGYGFALGETSIAMGYGVSEGVASMALGYYASASGYSSFAMGDSVTSSGYASFAFGMSASSTGYGSIAIGNSSLSTNEGSIAIGGATSAIGWGSVAIGFHTSALGRESSAHGADTVANSAYCFVVGRNNAIDGEESSSSWVESDPLFIIGNGTGEDNPSSPPEVKKSNAFVVRKNGAVEMTGPVTMPRQGDILMGEFGNPE